MCVLEKGQKDLVQINVFFMTLPLLGAKFCLGPCTDVFFCYAERRERFDTSHTLFAFAEHKLPVLFEGGGKTYAAWHQ